ncbi:MAG: S26 family signal peptidase, partial [Quinella sp. 1Q5]|nr:S26 family signal peptidase [Quinella sp. 1Q5]
MNSIIGQEVRSWIISIVSAIVVALLIRTFIVELYVVDGPSMQPTLQDG